MEESPIDANLGIYLFEYHELCSIAITGGQFLQD
jgi:hypothetical protein